MTTTTVLLPRDGREHLRGDALSDLDPLAYSHHRLGATQKIMRRLGRLGPDATLHAKLTLPIASQLEHTEALWLSEQVSLSGSEWRLLLDRLPRLRWIYSQRTSYHHLDPEIFRSRGIAVSNSGDLVTRWVAEFALACILSERKRIPEHARSAGARSGPIWGRPVRGARVLILGTGRIGAELAGMATALGMEVTGLSRSPGRFPDPPSPYARIRNLESDLAVALGETDFVVVALPSDERTRNILGPRELAAMPATASLISVTHPEVIDQDAVILALEAGRIASAYLDRVQPSRGIPRAGVPNLVLTHNSSAHVREKSAAAAARFVQGVRAMREGRVPDDRVV